MPEFTAAITTHNRADLVVGAVESVLAQTYGDYELLVVDDGSTDGTDQALEPYASHLRYVRQARQGRAGARNRAVAEALGRVVAFLDSDDLWLPDKLQRQAEAFALHPGAALVHGQVELIDEAGSVLPAQTEAHRRLFSAANAQPPTYAAWALESRCLTSTVAITAAALAEVGTYDPAIGVEDVDLYLRLVRGHEVVFLDGPPLARYRVHASQTGNAALARGQIDLAHKHLALLGQNEEHRLARRNFTLLLARSHNVLLEQRETRRALLAAVRIDPRLALRPHTLRRLATTFLPRGPLERVRRHRLRGSA